MRCAGRRIFHPVIILKAILTSRPNPFIKRMDICRHPLHISDWLLPTSLLPSDIHSGYHHGGTRARMISVLTSSPVLWQRSGVLRGFLNVVCHLMKLGIWAIFLFAELPHPLKQISVGRISGTYLVYAQRTTLRNLRATRPPEPQVPLIAQGVSQSTQPYQRTAEWIPVHVQRECIPWQMDGGISGP